MAVNAVYKPQIIGLPWKATLLTARVYQPLRDEIINRILLQNRCHQIVYRLSPF